MTETSVPACYVRLALMIDRHFPGYVDAYFGPPELKAQAGEGEPPAVEALADFAASLAKSIERDPGLAPQRSAFLQEEVRAMRTTLRILAGDALDFVEEVRLLYGVTPAWVSETVFEEAHRVLDDLLPGSGALPERVHAFRERSRLPVEAALEAMRRLVEELRGRTRLLFGLPDGEGCEICAVSDQSWMAYSWYLGRGRSRIELNRDHPLEAWNLPVTAAHETYPGHHTEFALKESRLYLAEGRLEHSILLSNNPSSLISEGIAANALQVAAPGEESAALLAECYAVAGLSQEDGKRAAAFAGAIHRLRSVSDNQLLLLHRDGAPGDEVVRYGVRYALSDPEDEMRYLRFYTDPLSRSYAYNYTLGCDLVAAALERAADRRQAFQRLLTEPVTPAQLQAGQAFNLEEKER